jgi:hypothetical protein
LKKQREIDGLKEEIERLRQKLSYEARKEKEGFFGSSTPSAKLPLKANADKDRERKPKGARPGHTGAGRKGASSVEVNRRMEPEVIGWVRNYKKLKDLIREISEIQKQIIRLRED